MLYGSLEQMSTDGLIEELSAPAGESAKRRYYRITRNGRAALKREADRMAALAALVRTRVS